MSTNEVVITSPHNAKIQQVRALQSRREERQRDGAFVIEGVRLVEEALAANWNVRWVLFSSQLSERGRYLLEQLRAKGTRAQEITPQLMERIAETETPPGILAVVDIPKRELPTGLDFLLVVDGLRDPGNLGTLLRSAQAAGVQAVLLTPGSADAFAPKVVRSAMGAHFRLAIQALTWEEILELCKRRLSPAVKLCLAVARGGVPCWQADLRRPLALIVGGEAEGASDFAGQHADELLTIPMPGGSESLNAAVAASILLFEIVRQRGL